LKPDLARVVLIGRSSIGPIGFGVVGLTRRSQEDCVALGLDPLYLSNFAYDGYVLFLPEEIAAARVAASKMFRVTACTSPTMRAILSWFARSEE
jgi:hypothetical protein